jgi:cytidine deaminase
MTDEVPWSELRSRAAAAAHHSYSPYSGFPVGAAALLRDGQVISAANVENASHGLGLCAETALVAVLVSCGGGRGDLVAVAVTGPDGADLSPCGRCRQLLHEMGGPALRVNGRRLSDLLPDAFGPHDLR